jgi:hypothetical protein
LLVGATDKNCERLNRLEALHTAGRHEQEVGPMVMPLEPKEGDILIMEEVGEENLA